MAEKILEIKNLTKKYGSQTILDGIDLSIDKGEVVVVVGPSGCGKSTLLRCINSLEDIDAGEIIHDGHKIGMVFQSYELFPHLSVLDNITLAPIKVQKREKAEVI